MRSHTFKANQVDFTVPKTWRGEAQKQMMKKSRILYHQGSIQLGPNSAHAVFIFKLGSICLASASNTAHHKKTEPPPVEKYPPHGASPKLKY